jgi:hypothetical protein
VRRGHHGRVAAYAAFVPAAAIGGTFLLAASPYGYDPAADSAIEVLEHLPGFDLH